MFNVVSKDQKDEQGNELVVQEGLQSATDGSVNAVDLAPGDYAFVETQAPTGYVLNQTEVPFTIVASSEDGESKITGLELINYQGAVSLTKVDHETKAVLAGAIFKLVDSRGTVVEEGLVSDTQGKLVVENLVPGSYQFIEAQAPVGYQLDEEAVDFMIADSSQGKPAVVTLEKTNKAIVPVAEKSKFKEDDNQSEEQPAKQQNKQQNKQSSKQQNKQQNKQSSKQQKKQSSKQQKKQANKRRSKQDLPQAGSESSLLLALLGTALIIIVVLIKRRLLVKI